MAFPTDWDVEKYHVEHECDDHWELRRRFLNEHKDKFPEERLVCLAQVFYNVEFYGCRYPEKTMRLVAELSQGVADDHREKMKTKLQRTFVQASDAASTKVKGRSRNEGTAPNQFKQINFQKANDRNPLSMDTLDNEKESLDNAKEENSQTDTIPEPSNKITADSHQNPTPVAKKSKKKKRSKKKPSGSNPSTSTDDTPGRFVLADQSRFENPNPNNKRPNEALPQSKKLKPGSIFPKLVLMESAGMNPYGILSRSTGASHMHLKQENRVANGRTEVTLSIGNEVLSQATAASAEEAKSQCAAEGLAKLKKLCYTVIIKDRLAGSVIDKQEVATNSAPIQNETPDHLAEDSKVNRMMKLMGWGGGGLGKDQQGRQEPVQVTQQVKRAGLGSSCPNIGEFKTKMVEMLKQFKLGEAKHDLVFASDFSKDERAAVHLIAQRFNLKSISYGKDENRQLVVSKKRTPWQIVKEVQDAGGSTDKYDLIPPEDNMNF